MIVYIPAGSGEIRDAYVAAGAGLIVQRYHWRNPKYDAPWILDNGAYRDWKRGTKFNGPQFERVLDRVQQLPAEKRPRWCVIPDLVGDPKSAEYSVSWRMGLPSWLPWYFALQDGMTPASIRQPLEAIRPAGLFVGGTLTWKNEKAAEWCAFGKKLGLPVHIGRLNGPRRLKWAVTIGADSVDGTGWITARWREWVSCVRSIPAADPAPESIFDTQMPPPRWSSASGECGSDAAGFRRPADRGDELPRPAIVNNALGRSQRQR